MKNKPLTIKNIVEIDMDDCKIIADAHGYSTLQDSVDVALLLDHSNIDYDLNKRKESVQEIKAIVEVEFDQRKDEFDEESAELEIRGYFDAIGAGLPGFEFSFEFRSRYCDILCNELEAEWENRSIANL